MIELGHEKRRWAIRIPLLIVLVLLVCAGCRSPVGTANGGQGTRADFKPTRVTPSATPLAAAPSILILPTVTPTSTSVPSPTPFPEVTVYAPENWIPQLSSALESLMDNGVGWKWQLTSRVSEANIVLDDTNGTVDAGEQPIAVIVPFTSEIEEITTEEAQQLINGTEATIMIVEWPGVPVGYKAIAVDGQLPHESGYPLQKRYFLHPEEGFEAAATALGETLRQMEPAASLVHLSVVGDIMLDRTLGRMITQGDLLYPFSEVKEDLQSADITIGNLESALGSLGEPVPKSYNFRAPPQAAQSLSLAGFDLLTLANNHAMDYGAEALLQGLTLLESNGIKAVGAGANAAEARAPVIFEEKGVRIGFLGYIDVPVEVTGFDSRSWEAGEDSPGLAWATKEHVVADVAAIKHSVDIVVVLLHSGYEFIEQPSPVQADISRSAVDAGADLVIGHHSHLLQGVEFYGDGVIFYGLGNFAFNMEGAPDSAILNVWLDREGIRNIEFLPVTIGPDGKPTYAGSTDSARIKSGIYRLSDLLN